MQYNKFNNPLLVVLDKLNAKYYAYTSTTLYCACRRV